MTNQLPIQQEDRTIIVDVLRGFALFGVLLGNLTSMLSNNVPEPIIDMHASALDHVLDQVHTVLIENKFMTLFSILFGYGFGVIMERLGKKNINSTPFFLRRMFWLFVFGCINLALWNGDILHIYAVTGVFLLLFRKSSNKFILFASVWFLFVLPACIRFYQHFVLNLSFHGQLVNEYYQAYKFGNLKQVAMTNYRLYPIQWIYTWVEWRDMSETLGRFLLGYYVLRRKFLIKLDENMSFIRRLWIWSLAVIIIFIPFQLLFDTNVFGFPRWVVYPFIKAGILFTTIFYATSIVQLYNKQKMMGLMEVFRNLGRMTLTNYLMQTIIYVIIFYNIGFALLGEFSFTVIWLASFAVYFLQGLFSMWWFTRFYYGPVEWVWRQLTYKKRFPILKQRAPHFQI